MKLRRLPEIDLATITPLPNDLQKVRLNSFEAGGGGWSYEAARSLVPDTLQAQDAFGMGLRTTTREELFREVERRCRRGTDERESNREVTELLFDWANKYCTRAVLHHIPSMTLGNLGVLRYWSNVIVEFERKPAALFLDHRRANGLTTVGRQVAFSMMHEQIRVADPNLADIELLILKFTQAKGQPRSIELFKANEVDLIDFEELSSMLENTYRIWAEVCEARRHDPRRERKAAASGSLL